MKTITRKFIFRPLAGALCALLVGVANAGAANVTVRDDAAFFSDRAKSEAARGIAEIGRRFRKDVVVETFKALPEDMKQGLSNEDKTALNRRFEQWAVSQARALKVNGIYILLTREPAHLQVIVGNDTQSRAFTLRDRDTLVGLMLGKLRQKQPDEALLEGVNFVGAAMASHAVAGNRPVAAPVKSAPEPANPWGWVLAAVLGGLAAWIVVRVIRAMLSGGAAGGATPGGGGGGFMSSLLGGMFGAAAGMWLYDQFTGHHGSSDTGSDLDTRRNDGGYSGQDSDYSGSGGDFGDSGGGDSAGSDDAGGGGDF